MHPHHANFKRYIELCLSKNTPVLLEDYINKHQKYIRKHADTNNFNEFQRWVDMFFESTHSSHFFQDIQYAVAKRKLRKVRVIERYTRKSQKSQVFV